MKRRTPGAVGYCCGALDALHAIYAWDGIGVAYKEVLNVFDVNELTLIARRTGRMRSSGLSERFRKQRLVERHVKERS